MLVACSIALFVIAALFEIAGVWLVWQGLREHKGWIWICADVIALGLYGFVAPLQADGNFGRILAAYGGIFVAGSIAWGMVANGYRPDRYDITSAVICSSAWASSCMPRAATERRSGPLALAAWARHQST
ncbi:hypothetical protein SSPIM334S_07914 [Streptomyces spiroverticillatus]